MTPPDLTRLVRDEVGRLGFGLVDVCVGRSPRRRHLQVRIDRPVEGEGGRTIALADIQEAVLVVDWPTRR